MNAEAVFLQQKKVVEWRLKKNRGKTEFEKSSSHIVPLYVLSSVLSSRADAGFLVAAVYKGRRPISGILGKQNCWLFSHLNKWQLVSAGRWDHMVTECDSPYLGNSRSISSYTGSTQAVKHMLKHKPTLAIYSSVSQTFFNNERPLKTEWCKTCFGRKTCFGCDELSLLNVLHLNLSEKNWLVLF